MSWANDFNDAGGGAAAYTKREIEKAVRPLEARVETLERKLADLQAKPRTFVQRMFSAAKEDT